MIVDHKRKKNTCCFVYDHKSQAKIRLKKKTETELFVSLFIAFCIRFGSSILQNWTPLKTAELSLNSSKTCETGEHKYSGLKSLLDFIIANSRFLFGSSHIINQNKEDQNSPSLTVIPYNYNCDCDWVFQDKTRHIYADIHTYPYVHTYIARLGLMYSLVFERHWDATGYTRGRNL